MTGDRWLVVLSAVATLCGCQEEPSQSPVFELELRAQRESGEPMAGVQFSRGERAMGVTGGDGEVRVRLRAREGMRLSIAPQCPEGYRGPDGDLEVVLRTLRTADGEIAPLTVQTTCRPTERMAALVVRTAPDIPVIVQGRQVARTNADGIAHASLTMEPNTTFRVELDTSDKPALRPRSPVTTLTVMDRDEIFPIAFEFKKEDKQVVRRPRPRVKPADKPPRPERVD